MESNMKNWGLRLLIVWVVLSPISLAQAQTYPDRAVKIVVPFGAGGITDVVARLIADKMAISLKQTVYVENKPGMGGALGPATVASAPPDGYTLLFGGTGNSIGQTLYGKKLSYDLVNDFTAISRVAEAVNVLCVNPKVPANTVAELIALIKSKPDQFLYASSGNGGLYHLAFELFKYMTDTKVRHIPYKTESAQRTDVVAGRIEMMIDAYGVVKGNVDDGQLRLLATTSTKRFAAIANVPTLAESGLLGYEADAWVGLLAPAGTPAEVVDKIYQAVAKALTQPDVQGKFAEQGLIPIGDTPPQAGDFIRKDVARWKEIIERAGVSVQ
jgi:tripartite-type tricarboxylate transporter receptor subunit TctC